jgi:hypothetical protein
MLLFKAKTKCLFFLLQILFPESAYSVKHNTSPALSHWWVLSARLFACRNSCSKAVNTELVTNARFKWFEKVQARKEHNMQSSLPSSVLLNSQSRRIHAKVMVRYRVKKFNAIYRTRELTTLFTRARLLPISSATEYGLNPSQLFLKIRFISIKFPPLPTSRKKSSVYSTIFPCWKTRTRTHTRYKPHLSHSLRSHHRILMWWKTDILRWYCLTLCRSNLNPYCLGRKAAFFSVGIKYMYLPVRFSAFRPAGGI